MLGKLTQINTFMRHDEYSNSTSTPMLLFFLTLTLLMWRIRWAHTNASKWQMGLNLAFKGLIFKGTACKLTLSHFGSQFQWLKWKQILTIECAICEDRDTTADTSLHQGTRSTELTKLIATFSTICCFLLPKTLKVS